MARILLGVAILELVVARFGIALIGPRPIISGVAGFTRSFAAVLALLTAVVGVHGMLRDRVRFSGGARALVAIASAAFLPLAAVDLAVGLPGWLDVHVHTALLAAIASLLVAAYVAPLHPVACTGVFCLAVAPLAHGAGEWLLAHGTALGPTMAAAAEPATQIGSVVTLGMGVLAILAVQPARLGLVARGRGAVWAAVGAFVAVALVRAFPGLPGILFGLPAPAGLADGLPAAASVFLLLLALGAVRGVSRRRRAVRRGLALLAVTGALLGDTGHLLVVYAAFVLLVRGAAFGAPPVDRWHEWVRAVAQRVEAGEPVVIGLRGEEVSRMRIERGPVDVRLARRGDDVVQVDVTAGSPPRSPPAWSARHRRAAQPRAARLPEASARPHVDLPAGIDCEIVVRGDGAAELDDELRRLLLALPPGALAVWPSEGARWRGFPADTSTPDRPVPMSEIDAGRPAPTEDLVGVVQVVREVARRAGIRC